MNSEALIETSHPHWIETSHPHWFVCGVRFSFNSDSNRVRRRVVRVDSATAFTFVTHVRPSKGFARHLRRTKAAKDKP